jgi:ribose 5-phosphate isomerase A
MTDTQDEQKQAVGEAAAALVEDGMVVGLGTGSTARFLVDALGRRVGDGLRIVGIPTSERTAEQARSVGIPLVGLDTHPRIDLTVDGADEIELGSLALIKGLGGALLREKIVAAASKRLVIIADESKLVKRLGRRTPVPVEVVRFGWQATAAHLRELGAEPTLRHAGGDVPFITDGGNLILDCKFDGIADPRASELAIDDVVGVVESGLFINRAECALVAGIGGVRRIMREG